ncbi:hypothetical protein [Streptomyces daliensis]|uniref:Uncharacterized protein n=1 Tax=Streptomyces daliensis TaxID=299421 RepID=A0A8T4IRT3_9ACTN|nr:hypothetical protein [Streptomyces daliensis]
MGTHEKKTTTDDNPTTKDRHQSSEPANEEATVGTVGTQDRHQSSEPAS